MQQVPREQMEKRNLKIGIVCYQTFGGSGTVAADTGLAMAERGHRVHFISSGIPSRLSEFHENVFLHEVQSRDYPVFVSPPYTLSVASKLVEIAQHQSLDIVHVHYGVPHATSAFLAAQVLGESAPKIVSTLHGTDITIAGKDPSYLPITRFSILKSDALTVPSRYLKNAIYDKIHVPVETDIRVIPNFVDANYFSPCDVAKNSPGPKIFSRPCSDSNNLLVHVSNFRPVKRVDHVIEVFELVQKEVPCQLVFVGDGPERPRAEELVREKGLVEEVCFLGKQDSFVEVLKRGKVFLLPSSTESFGLAALEAMSCGMPVVASNVDGIPELVSDGESGFLSSPGDVKDMAKNTLRLLSDEALHTQMSKQARKRSVEDFNRETLVDSYEELYYEVLDR